MRRKALGTQIVFAVLLSLAYLGHANAAFNVEARIDADGPGGNLAPIFVGTTAFINDAVGTSEYTDVSIQVSASESPSPFISYGLAFTDLANPSTVDLRVDLQIPGGIGPIGASASFSGSGSDGGDGTVTITATSPTPATLDDGVAPLLVQVGSFSTAGGSNFAGPFTNLGVDLGPDATIVNGIPGGSDTYGPFSGSNPLGALGVTNLRLDVNYTGSGGGDAITVNGRIDLTELPTTIIPEPASYYAWSLLISLFGAGIVLRRRPSASG